MWACVCPAVLLRGPALVSQLGSFSSKCWTCQANLALAGRDVSVAYIPSAAKPVSKKLCFHWDFSMPAKRIRALAGLPSATRQKQEPRQAVLTLCFCLSFLVVSFSPSFPLYVGLLRRSPTSIIVFTWAAGMPCFNSPQPPCLVIIAAPTAALCWFCGYTYMCMHVMAICLCNLILTSKGLMDIKQWNPNKHSDLALSHRWHKDSASDVAGPPEILWPCFCCRNGRMGLKPEVWRGWAVGDFVWYKSL